MNRPGHLRTFPKSIGKFLLEHARRPSSSRWTWPRMSPSIAIFHGEDASAADLILKRPARDGTSSPRKP